MAQDLLATVTQAQNELNARAAALDTTAKQLDDLNISLGARERDLRAREAFNHGKEEELGRREDVLLSADAQNARISQLQELDRTTSQKLADNKALEARVLDLDAAVKQREQLVLAREQAVTEREAKYKETLKAQFLDELSKQLGR